MPISRVPGVGLDSGSSGVAPSNLSTGAPSWDGSGNVTCLSSISVGNATPTTSGFGITFPATQSASSNANTLDDYEEGDWTPSSGISVTGASGRYTKIGRVVQWSCVFTYAASGSGNSAYIGGLPFTCENANAARAGSSIGYTDYGTANMTVLFANNDISAFFYNFSGANLTYANLSGKTIYCGGTYLTTT